MFGALDTLQYPELHDESIGVLAFTRHVYRLMFACGIADFSLRVRDPTPPRRARRARTLPACKLTRTAPGAGRVCARFEAPSALPVGCAQLREVPGGQAAAAGGLQGGSCRRAQTLRAAEPGERGQGACIPAYAHGRTRPVCLSVLRCLHLCVQTAELERLEAEREAAAPVRRSCVIARARVPVRALEAGVSYPSALTRAAPCLVAGGSPP